MASYLDETGLARVWGKVKGLFTKSNVETALGYTIDKNVPSDAVFTDSNVTQTATDGSSNTEYEVLFSGTADNTTRTEGARKTRLFTFNPQTNQVTAGHFTAESGSPSGTKTASLIGNDVQLGGTSNTWDGTNTSLKTTISGINSSLSDLLKTKTVSHSYSIAANGETHWNPTSDTDFPETGYTPIGVITFNCNNTNVCPTILAIGNSNWNMCLRNLSSSTQANTFQYTVLYMKNFS